MISGPSLQPPAANSADSLLLTTVATVAVVGISILALALQKYRRKESSSAPLAVGVFGAGAVGVIAGLKLIQGDDTYKKASRSISKIILVGRDSLDTQVKASDGRMRIIEHFPGGATTSFSVDNDDNNHSTTDQRLQLVNSNNRGDDLTPCLQDCEVILVATKTIDTKTVARDLAKILPISSNATVLSLQNGLHNCQVLKDQLQRSHPLVQVLTTVVAFPAEWEEDSTNYHIALKGKIFVEPPTPSSSSVHKDRVQTLVTNWTNAQLPSRISHRIVAIQYIKLFMNLINPINALAGIPVPIQMATYDYRRVLAAAIAEGTYVLCRQDPNLAEATIDRWLIRIVGGWIVPAVLTGIPNFIYEWALIRTEKTSAPQTTSSSFDYKSSMLQDLERRRSKTEIEDLSGVIVRLAVEANGDENATCAAPINAALCDLIHQAEAANTGSPRLAGAELCQRVGL